MNITIDLPVKDEQQKKELEKYLLQQAREFLDRKEEDVLDLVEVDYGDVPEEVKKSFDELFDKNGNVKDFTRFNSVENVF